MGPVRFCECILRISSAGCGYGFRISSQKEINFFGSALNGLSFGYPTCHAVEGAWRVVDRAMDIMGGYGISRKSGFERLFRDARLGKIHPSNSYLTREILAKGMLGLDLDYQPR